MTESQAASKPRPWPRRTLRWLGGLGRRAYALALIVLVLYLSGAAFWYLLRSLLLPAGSPPQIVDVPRRLDAEVLERGTPFAGMRAAENPRTPPAHYHRVGGALLPDRFNDCARSGCHAPIPHGRNRANRAFLNMHTTAMHCGVCHLETDSTPAPLTWYSLADGEASDPPALLAAYAWLTDPEHVAQERFTAQQQAEIVSLIRAASAAAQRPPGLEALALRLGAFRADGTQFVRVVALARETLPQHFRGEYGAKLALRDPATGEPRLGHAGTAEAVRAFLALDGSAPEEQRQELLRAVHPQRRADTLHCTDCHQPEVGRVDLAAAGYPPERVAALQRGWIFSAIEHIAEGRPLHLPGFMRPDEAEVPAPEDPSLPARPDPPGESQEAGDGSRMP